MQSQDLQQLFQRRRNLVILMVLCLMVAGSATTALAVAKSKHGSHAKALGEAYVYKTVDGNQLHLYVMQPKVSSPKLKPAIIFFHGGGWVALQAGQFNRWAKPLVDRGMVSIEVQYRLLDRHDKVPPKICAEDAKSAVRWVREHHSELGIDPNKIVESGGSAGGYLAAFATMVPGWNDPHDDLSVSSKANLLALFNPVIDNSPSGYGYWRFGESYKRYSPYFYTSKSTPPTLIMSGTDDKLIHASVLKAVREKLEDDGVPCKLVLYKGQSHGFFNHPPYVTETREELMSFLKKYKYIDSSK